MDNQGLTTEVNEEPQPRISRLMTVSIVLGIVDHIIFLGLIGSARGADSIPPHWTLLGLLLIAPAVGIVAIAQIWLSRGRLEGPMSVWGFLGVWLMMAFVLAVIIPVFANRPYHADYARRTRCATSMRRLGLAMFEYAQDCGNKLPPADWNSALSDYIKSNAVLRCPEEEDQTQPSYAMNVKTLGLNAKQAKRVEELVLLFESVPGKNLAGGPALLPHKPRHSRGENYAFADGHVKYYARDEGVKLRWDSKEKTK